MTTTKTEKTYASHRKWVEKNLERYRAYHKKYNALESTKKRRKVLYQKKIGHKRKIDNEHYAKTKDRHRELWACRKYSISSEVYRELAKRNVCDVCGQLEIAIDNNRNIKRLAIDHDHKTGRVRGVLCQRCNQAIGLLREDTEIMRKIISYLYVETKTS